MTLLLYWTSYLYNLIFRVVVAWGFENLACDQKTQQVTTELSLSEAPNS